MAEEVRIIKKYSNRRLYDKETSQYVTLAEVRQLVMDGIDFKVVDVASGDDITRQVLLQIISEQEAGNQPMFSKELLTHMIRFYGGAFQSMFTDYMNRSVEMLNSQQQAYQKKWQEAFGMDGLSAMNEIAQENIKRWEQMQQEMLGFYGIKPKDGD